MPTSYRVEVSPNNRAACKNKECKDKGLKLTKGELRFGTWVSIPDGKGGDHSSWHWRHWGCVTPSILSNLKQMSDGDLDLVDGYDELPDHFQPKIERALQRGHVDDEDWNGDIDANRPGHKGMRMKASKSKIAGKSTQDLESENPKPESKKRGRPKKVVNDDHVEISIPKKARKVSTQRPRLNKHEDDAHEMEPQQAASGSPNGQGANTGKARGKKGTSEGTPRATNRADKSKEREEQKNVKVSSQRSKSKKMQENAQRSKSVLSQDI